MKECETLVQSKVAKKKSDMTFKEFISRVTKQPRMDPVFLIAAMLLLIIGLVMLFSASFAASLFKTGNSYTYILKQIQMAVVGVVAMMIVSFVPFSIFKIPLFNQLFYWSSVALLIAVLILPSNDAQKRWIYIAGIQFQPSELAKLAVIIMLAWYLSKVGQYVRKPTDNFLKYHAKSFGQNVLVPGLIFGLCAGLVLIETHLSGGMLIALVGCIMLVACGNAKTSHLLPIFIAVLVAGVILIFATDYMQARIEMFIDPASDPTGDGFQILQSLYAIGSGGTFGLGFGKSRQKYLYLPEPQNDFIFSVVCEEIGFIGAAFIVILFAILIWRGIYIAMNAPDKFSSLLVLGIISRIAVQVLFNLAVISKLIPVTGISLPFFSYGGTALAVLLVEIGIVLQVSRYSYLKKD